MRIQRILRGGMFFICAVMLMAGFLSAEVSAAEENGFDGGGGGRRVGGNPNRWKRN